MFDNHIDWLILLLSGHCGWINQTDCWRAALQKQYLFKLFVYGLWPQALPQAKTVRFEHQPPCNCQL